MKPIAEQINDALESLAVYTVTFENAHIARIILRMSHGPKGRQMNCYLEIEHGAKTPFYSKAVYPSKDIIRVLHNESFFAACRLIAAACRPYEIERYFGKHVYAFFQLSTASKDSWQKQLEKQKYKVTKII